MSRLLLEPYNPRVTAGDIIYIGRKIAKAN